VASATTLSSLPTIGSEAVRIALRAAAAVDRVTQITEATNETSPSYAILIESGTMDEIQEELETFFQSQVRGRLSLVSKNYL
jgi:hypothetical protein